MHILSRSVCLRATSQVAQLITWLTEGTAQESPLALTIAGSVMLTCQKGKIDFTAEPNMQGNQSDTERSGSSDTIVCQAMTVTFQSRAALVRETGINPDAC